MLGDPMLGSASLLAHGYLGPDRNLLYAGPGAGAQFAADSMLASASMARGPVLVAESSGGFVDSTAAFEPAAAAGYQPAQPQEQLYATGSAYKRLTPATLKTAPLAAETGGHYSSFYNSAPPVELEQPAAESLSAGQQQQQRFGSYISGLSRPSPYASTNYEQAEPAPEQQQVAASYDQIMPAASLEQPTAVYFRQPRPQAPRRSGSVQLKLDDSARSRLFEQIRGQLQQQIYQQQQQLTPVQSELPAPTQIQSGPFAPLVPMTIQTEFGTGQLKSSRLADSSGANLLRAATTPTSTATGGYERLTSQEGQLRPAGGPLAGLETKARNQQQVATAGGAHLLFIRPKTNSSPAALFSALGDKMSSAATGGRGENSLEKADLWKASRSRLDSRGWQSLSAPASSGERQSPSESDLRPTAAGGSGDSPAHASPDRTDRLGSPAAADDERLRRLSRTPTGGRQIPPVGSTATGGGGWRGPSEPLPQYGLVVVEPSTAVAREAQQVAGSASSGNSNSNNNDQQQASSGADWQQQADDSPRLNLIQLNDSAESNDNEDNNNTNRNNAIRAAEPSQAGEGKLEPAGRQRQVAILLPRRQLQRNEDAAGPQQQVAATTPSAGAGFDIGSGQSTNEHGEDNNVAGHLLAPPTGGKSPPTESKSAAEGREKAATGEERQQQPPPRAYQGLAGGSIGQAE